MADETPPAGPDHRLGRRLMVLRLAALGGTAAALAGCVAPGQVQYGNPWPRGTGITDADPSDGPGHGRGGRRATGITDADPSDGPGHGRGGHRGVSGGTGITDRDPSDGAGRGRGGYRGTGRTDSDPRDAPGRGRW